MSKKAPSVATIPFLEEQWDYERNTEDILSVSSVSRIPVHWRCKKCGYAWSASPKSRYKAVGRCPCCDSGKVICRGVNDVFTVVPKLMESYDFEKNGDFDIYSEGLDSSKRVFWKCPICGRSWETTIRARIKRIDGQYITVPCPHYNTAKRKAHEVPVVADVPNLIKFWNQNTNHLDPHTTRSNSMERAAWICDRCGYTWETTIVSQSQATGKCACCELHIAKKAGVSDAFALLPELKESYDFSKNSDVDIENLGIRNKEVLLWWHCPVCGFEWQAPIASRVRGALGNYSVSKCRQCYLQELSQITPISSVPSLLRFWDFSKNVDIDPNLTSAYSNERAYWRCKDCGYTWSSTIQSRKYSSGLCPCCEGGTRTFSGRNDVVTLVPDILSIFDANANPGIDLSACAPSSKEVVSWTCKKCAYTWSSTIDKRVKKISDGSYRLVDCPNCSNLSKRKQTYAEQYPELLPLFDEEKNGRTLASIVSSESNTVKFWWNCQVCGNSFQSRLHSMIVSQKTSTKGCPYCSRMKLLPGESFAEVHKDLMAEYDPANTIDPFTVFPTRNDAVSWICPNNPEHKWVATFGLRHAGGGRCPICNRTQLYEDINSFAAVYPDLVEMWSPSNERAANKVFYNSSLWFSWVCPTCSGEYGAFIKDVIETDNPCPYCTDRLVLPKFNSLAARHPKLAELWAESNERSADEVLPTLRGFANWICSTCHGEYKARVADMVSGEADCPYCNDRQVLPHFNSLAARYPKIAALWAESNERPPDEILPSLQIFASWICPDCHGEYRARVADMVSGAVDCPYCNDRQVLPGFNSFMVRHKDLMDEWDSLSNYLLADPNQIGDFCTIPVWWNCPHNKEHHYIMSPKQRSLFQKRQQEPCLYCKGKRRKKHHFV